MHPAECPCVEVSVHSQHILVPLKLTMPQLVGTSILASLLIFYDVPDASSVGYKGDPALTCDCLSH